MGTVQVRLRPLQAPVQDRNLQPFAGVAVSCSATNDGNDAAQRGRQVIPERELRTVPRPETATESRKVSGAKSAETVAPEPMVIAQVPEPLQAPLQRASFMPGLGTPLSVKRVPAFQVVVHDCTHWSPGTSETTEPAPLTVTVKGCCRSICTSQGASCESRTRPHGRSSRLDPDRGAS